MEKIMFDIFKTVPNYTAMLNKLGIFNFFITLIALHYLTEKIPDLKLYFNQVTTIDVMGVPIPLGIIIASLTIAIINRSIKLHDRISDLLRLRASYDWNYIAKPIAEEVGATPNKKKILRERNHVIRNIFYKYTSSQIQPPIIRAELIELIMDQLSWSWIALEASATFLLCTTALLLYSQDYYFLLLATLLSFTTALLLLRSCKKYTAQEIRSIIESPNRKREIRDFLNAL